MTAFNLNRRLATLLGWSNIIELGGALLGTPPAGEPQCRNQAVVPNWAGDWRYCGPLMVEHDCYPEMYQGEIIVQPPRPPNRHWPPVYRAPRAVGLRLAKSDGALLAIVSAVIAKLESNQ
jgi:hypothetical protein